MWSDKPLRFVLHFIFIVQLLGALSGSALLCAHTSEIPVVNTFLEETTMTQGILIDMFITSALVVSFPMRAAENHQATAFAPAIHPYRLLMRLLPNASELRYLLHRRVEVCRAILYLITVVTWWPVLGMPYASFTFGSEIYL
ncbi:putative major intrinsic protein [Lyophyllum shimeji]|uniref:Major intrinsic protein n=1 Tax=Lyophyllum shimeji TaxID=47721 RepID=A0A9P3Q0A4_LYOSH|nr:putative major intrinsic protein [Lyophyllum shimeji]